MRLSEVFEAGDKALLVDEKGRHYLFTLQGGASFHFHRGMVHHDEIIQRPEGLSLVSTGGAKVVVLKPTYADYALKMRRGAQVIYPKDVAMILMHTDIFPGARVLEAGVGSGALTMALLRAVGPQGKVTSCDVRPDFIETARANIEGFLGKTDNLELREASIYEPLNPAPEADRAVLDLPEPWRAIPQLIEALAPGGGAAFFLPTVPQVVKLVDELQESARWTMIGTLENLTRTWKIEGRSVRPDHRMVAHTGFITTARLLSNPS